jgi:hypothetical protein
MDPSSTTPSEVVKLKIALEADIHPTGLAGRHVHDADAHFGVGLADLRERHHGPFRILPLPVRDLDGGHVRDVRLPVGDATAVGALGPGLPQAELLLVDPVEDAVPASSLPPSIQLAPAGPARPWSCPLRLSASSTLEIRSWAARGNALIRASNTARTGYLLICRLARLS